MTPGHLSTILPRIAQGLPPDLPRCIHSLGHPIEVLECVASGFDIFCCGWAQVIRFYIVNHYLRPPPTAV